VFGNIALLILNLSTEWRWMDSVTQWSLYSLRNWFQLLYV